MNWIKSSSAKVLLISVIWILYIIFVIVPFAENQGLLNATTPPQEDKTLIYFLLTTPVFIAYIVFLCICRKKITFPKSLIYPLIITSLYIGLFACLLAMGWPILWFVVLTIVIVIIAIIVSFIIGLIKDIRYRKKLKQGEQNNT